MTRRAGPRGRLSRLAERCSCGSPKVVAADGPAHPLSSRPHAGVLGGSVFAYRFRPSQGVQSVVLPLDTLSVVTTNDELSWAFYADDTAAVTPPWASLAVCVDVVFDDGSRLSQGVVGQRPTEGECATPVAGRSPMIDRYGFEVTAPAQFAARWSMPEQWNANTCSLGAWAGRRIVAVECVLGDEALREVPGWASGYIEVVIGPGDPLAAGQLANFRPKGQEASGPADLVDTRRGAHAGPEFSRGNTIPAFGAPHGFALVTPVTDAGDPRWPYRPHIHDDPVGRRLEAVQICHHASPWIGDFGVLQLMPFSGTPTSLRAKRRRHIRPGTELARPYGYAADLVESGLRLSVTASSHTAAFRVVGDGAVGFVIDQVDDQGDLRFEQDATGRVEFYGWVEQRADQAWGNAPRTYFVGQASGPAQWGRLDDDGRGRVAGYLRRPDLGGPAGHGQVSAAGPDVADFASQGQCSDSALVEESAVGHVVTRAWADPSPFQDEATHFVGGTARQAGVDDHAGVFEVRVATSFISVDQARHSLALEAGWSVSFETIQSRTQAAWNRLCSTITVGIDKDERRALADRDLRATIAADLYRLHLYPQDMSENTGTEDEPAWHYVDVFGSPTRSGVEDSRGQSGPMTSTSDHTHLPIIPGHAVVTNGYWDTYRTVWPLLSLLDPSLTGELLEGQLAQARRGGWMARWSAPGYVDCMVGTSSDQIFADAARWGVTGFDQHLAFETGWRNACEPSPDHRVGRVGVGQSRFTGRPPRVAEGFSWMIEGAISDAALGRFAQQLASDTEAVPTATHWSDRPQSPESHQLVEPLESGESLQQPESAESLEPPEFADPSLRARYHAFARYFANRAKSYRQLFDRTVGFFRGDAARTTRFDPARWGGDYTETNAWGMSVSAVHDLAGLSDLYGGPAGLRRHLDRLFATPELARDSGGYGQVIHEQREARAVRSGMCALSNQPAHHIPYIYIATDQPWRAGPLVRDLARRLFTGGHIAQGYPGDEDNGEMSAWWLWALLGLYPLELASGELLIGCPLVDHVSVTRSDGSRLRVRSYRREGEHPVSASDQPVTWVSYRREGEHPQGTSFNNASDIPVCGKAEYLVEARLNGAPLTSAVLPIDALQGGGDVDLDLVFASNPQDSSLWKGGWASPTSVASCSSRDSVPTSSCPPFDSTLTSWRPWHHRSAASSDPWRDASDPSLALAASDGTRRSQPRPQAASHCHSAFSVMNPWCPDLSQPDWSIGSSTVRPADAFNDWSTPDTSVPLEPGGWVGQHFPHPTVVTDMTLTTVDATSSDSWEVECSTDGEQWERVPPTHREPLPPNRTTPFQLYCATAACWWRVRFTAPARLVQVEFFNLDADM